MRHLGKEMDEEGGVLSDRIPVNVKIVDLAHRRIELALNCRFQSICIARSKNCHICPRRGGVQYTLKNSEDDYHGTSETTDRDPAAVPDFLQNPIRRG